MSLRRELAAAITAAAGPNAQFIVGPAYGIRQPRMSELERGKVYRTSMEWLIRRIHLMGGSVALTITLPDVQTAHRRASLAYQRQRKAIVPLRPYSLYGRGLDP